jgi:hypothetical protein
LNERVVHKHTRKVDHRIAVPDPAIMCEYDELPIGQRDAVEVRLCQRLLGCDRSQFRAVGGQAEVLSPLEYVTADLKYSSDANIKVWQR